MCDVNKNQLVKTFCELARIKSPSGEEGKMASNVIKRLKNIGISSEKDSYGNVVARIDGFGKPLILCGHLDTVAVGSKEEINPAIKVIKGEERIVSTGETILGADNKDYVTAILEALTVLKEKNLSHRALEIVFTVGEEKISEGAKALEFSLLRGKECLISDSSDPYGTITLSAPYYEKFSVEVIGKATHTKNPENGINAIDVAIKIITLMPIGIASPSVRSNVAFIAGGLKSSLDDICLGDIRQQGCNSVSDYALFCGEIRGYDKSEFEDVLTQIKKACDIKTGAQIKFKSERLAEGYMHDRQDTFISQIASVFKEQGVPFTFADAIGGSDANIFNTNDIKTVVISSAHRNNHEKSEHLIIGDLMKLTDFLLRIVRQE